MLCPAQSTRPVFDDQPAARALYDQMAAALRASQSLQWQGQLDLWAKDGYHRSCRYDAWLKKPNFFRIEGIDTQAGVQAVLVGNGSDLFIYWPKGRPRFSSEIDDEQYEKTRRNVYETKPAGQGEHSIWHEFMYMGLPLPVLDVSTFHGYTDSLQPYIDGMRVLPAEIVEGQECDVIEVSFMKGQRSWRLWIARGDHLPRRQESVVRVSYDLVTHERWLNLVVDGEIPDETFAWKPPPDWQPWKRPDPEDRLLKPGAEAPDFELKTADGKTARLSQYHSQVVLLYIWRGG